MVVSATPDYFTIPEAAKLLKRHPTLIQRWCRTEKIKAWFVGNRWLIDREALIEFAKVPRQPGNPNFVRSNKKKNSRK